MPGALSRWSAVIAHQGLARSTGSDPLWEVRAHAAQPIGRTVETAAALGITVRLWKTTVVPGFLSRRLDHRDVVVICLDSPFVAAGFSASMHSKAMF